MDAEYDCKFAALGFKRPECEHEPYLGPRCPDPVGDYLTDLHNLNNCEGDSECDSYRKRLEETRQALRDLGFHVPTYAKTHLTADLQFGRVGYSYRDLSVIGIQRNAGVADLVQGSLHGAFTINDVNVDICALAGIGGVAGEFKDASDTLDTIAWQAHLKGCAGVQAGKLFNIRGEIGYDSSFAAATSDVQTQKLTVDGSLANIAGTPLGVGYTFENESDQTGKGPTRSLGTQIVNVRGTF